MPDVEVLNGGLEILKTADLRERLIALTMPHLRIYGYLDGLVPRKVVPLLDALWPESDSLVIAKAAHAPFISHPAEFCSALSALSQRLA
jgi:pimeloyl-[acyl-carrier protein] methyl ester esterase